MIEELLRLSSIISMVLLAALFFYTGAKFFKIWKKTHEESLFHLGMLSIGMILYFLILMVLIVFSEDPETTLFIIKRIVCVAYSLMSLEMSLFYVTAFTNRRSLWEKYIPFVFGITTGTSLAIFGMIEDLWFSFLLVIAYLTPLVPITILVIRIVIRSYFLLKDDQLSSEDKGFIKVLVGTAVILFVGALLDLSFFWLVIFIGAEIWNFIVMLSGIISPLTFILAVYLVRTVFSNIEDADIIHLMNLLS